MTVPIKTLLVSAAQPKRPNDRIGADKKGIPTLACIVRNKILADVAAGAFRPGTRLEENELARRYQVSRTPVREALRDLAVLGAVEMKARRGVVVADQSSARLTKTLEVVADLEASCARYAAVRMTKAQRAELKEAHRRVGDAAKAGDAVRFDLENQQFHFLVHAGSANDILMEVVVQMRMRILPYTSAGLISNRDQLATFYRDHEAIVRAIELRDGELAYHATRAHVIAAGQVADDTASSPSGTS